jgi:hypothetical protein
VVFVTCNELSHALLSYGVIEAASSRPCLSYRRRACLLFDNSLEHVYFAVQMLTTFCGAIVITDRCSVLWLTRSIVQSLSEQRFRADYCTSLFFYDHGLSRLCEMFGWSQPCMTTYHACDQLAVCEMPCAFWFSSRPQSVLGYFINRQDSHPLGCLSRCI